MKKEHSPHKNKAMAEAVETKFYLHLDLGKVWELEQIIEELADDQDRANMSAWLERAAPAPRPPKPPHL